MQLTTPRTASVLTRITHGCLAIAMGLVMTLNAGHAQAQGLFAPAITVNDSVITGYEIQQRALMLQLLRAPGDPQKTAREQLIDDRLRLQAAADAGLVPVHEDVLDGMTEFAARANLDREKFIQELGRAGVAEQTFRDFIRAGVVWRQLVQARFSGRASASEAEIDRAMSSTGGQGNIRVLLSEIIMPVPPGQIQVVQERANRLAELTSISEFSAAARNYSATPTRGSGGRLPWRNLADLPPPLQPIVLGLAPGEVSDPLPLPDAIALFQMRAIEETGFTPPAISAVEYAMYFMPGGRSPETLAKARVIASQSDRCDDLYGVAKGQPEEVLERVTLPMDQVPTDIAIELNRLDAGEVSTTLTRNNGQTLVFLMMCGRTLAAREDADREQLALGLLNQRLNSLANGYLAQLKANARIIEK